MKKFNLLFLFLAMSVLLNACWMQDRPDPSTLNGFETIQVPNGFDYKTNLKVSLSVDDQEPSASAYYNIAFLEEDGTEVDLGRAFLKEGESGFDIQVNVPTYVTELMVKKIINGAEVEEKVTLAPETYVTFTNNQRIANCTSRIYGVNGDSEFFQIDQNSGNYEWEFVEEKMSDGGSIACAVDKYNGRVYVNFGQKLRYFTLSDSTWTTVATTNPFNGSYPRMEYHHGNDELWTANNTKMHILEASDGSLKRSYDILGLESPTGGGDIAISLNGDVYMCCFSGLYKITEINEDNGTVSTVRISAEGLPWNPTSLAIDENDRLFMGTNNSNSLFIEMDKETGAYDTVAIYNTKINDLSALPCTVDECPQTDTDNDGCIDCIDEFPEDPNNCGTVSSPSKLGWGSVAFEDLWPSKGDYDFNDIVVNYRYKLFLNGNNEATKMEITLIQKARSASYDNGYGIAFPAGVKQADIASVTGTNLTTGTISTTANGTEAGHGDQVVIIAYDRSFLMSDYGSCLPDAGRNTLNIVVEFTAPLNLESAGLMDFPYNPFIFQNGVRAHEIHLFNEAPTALYDAEIFKTFEDNSDEANGEYYQTASKHPWGISIIHDYRVVNEGIDITRAYNNFKAWAESGGVTNADWYKDNAGNRNTEHICTDN